MNRELWHRTSSTLLSVPIFEFRLSAILCLDGRQHTREPVSSPDRYRLWRPCPGWNEASRRRTAFHCHVLWNRRNDQKSTSVLELPLGMPQLSAAWSNVNAFGL